jgi:CDP-diacylglycerol pyrophosphatase
MKIRKLSLPLVQLNNFALNNLLLHFMLAVIVLVTPVILESRGLAETLSSENLSQSQCNEQKIDLLTLAECCAESLSRNPSCRYYDANDQFSIVRDNSSKKTDAYLLIPTQSVTGLEEDPKVLSPIWTDAWSHSNYLGNQADWVGLALNSFDTRQFEQLHIHISCVSPAVKKTLDAKAGEIQLYPDSNIFKQIPFDGRSYEVIKVRSLKDITNPFSVIQSIPGFKRCVAAHRFRDCMATQGIAVVGKRNANEYFVLETFSHNGRGGIAEHLLEQTCTTAR